MTSKKAKHGRDDQFAFYMDLLAHDILNNNQAVLGYLELVLATPSVDKTVRKYAEKAFSHVRTSTMLVENVKRLMATRMADSESLRAFDIMKTLQMSEKDLSRFFPDKRIRVKLNHLPKEIMVIGNSAAEDLVLNVLVNAVRLDAGEDVELAVKVAGTEFRGRDCWKLTVEDTSAVLPPSLKDKDIKYVYLMDSSVAVKLSGLLFAKMTSEMLGGDFDAYELPGKGDRPGAGFVLTLRRAGRP